MTALKVAAFDGLVPRMSPTLLGPSMAQVADNVKLYSKELRFWRGPIRAHTSTLVNPKTIFKLYNPAGANIWLVWNKQVEAVIGPVADVSDTRLYYTGDGTPKKTNYTMAQIGGEPYPHSFLEMGVPKPASSPLTSVTTDGSGTQEDRAYVYTYVSTFGTVQEEGRPSDPSNVTVHPNGCSVKINGFSAPPAGNYNITSRRIYRTVVGNSTVNYQFVAEVAIGLSEFTESLTAIQLGETLGTLGWFEPPPTLAGLVAMPSGTLAGFVGNTVYFSEPFFPHAWPLAYALSLPANVVGLAVMGTDLVVMTDNEPFFIHGGIPGSMYTERIQMQEPCVGRNTIARDADGIIYASPNGLVGIAPYTRGLVTHNLFTTDEWQPLIPATMKGVIYQGRYLGVFPDEVPSRAIVLNKTDTPGLSHLSLPASCLHVDARNAQLFYADDNDGNIYQLDADTAQPLSYEWRSRRWQLDQAVSLGCARLDADYSQLTDATAYNALVAEIAAANAVAFTHNLQSAINASTMDSLTINGSTMQAQPEQASSRTVQVILYGDGEVVGTISFDSLDPIRLEPFKCREFEFAILGNVFVRSFAVATTIDELKQ